MASVRIPKFASFRCTFVCELRNQRTTSELWFSGPISNIRIPSRQALLRMLESKDH